MNVYEVFAIAHPSLSQEEFLALVTELEKKLEQAGGRIVTRKVEQDQSLSYPIEGEFKGHIVHIDVELPSGTELSSDVRQEMVHHEKVLRYLEFKKDMTPVAVSAETQQSIIDRMRAKARHGGEERHPRARVHTPAPAEKERGTMDEKAVDEKIEELLK